MIKQLVIQGQLISYIENEQASDNRPALVFLHGWRSSAALWKTILSQFGDYQFYALDLPGFGGSPAPAHAFTLGDYCAIVAEFIGKLQLKNVVLIGHSFGGRIAIKLAATKPELVSKLVLVDSHGFVVKSVQKSLISSLAKLVKPLFRAKVMQGVRKRIYRSIGAEDYIATPELRNTFVNVITEDLQEFLGKIKAPTLLVWGENDKDTPVEFGKLFNSKIKNSELIIIAKAGHFSFIDQPKVFTSKLRKFIEV